MFFYYDNFKNIYKSRFSAITSLNPCYFYYYDKEFSKVDWTAEPSESLQNLYKKRAETLREQNEYLILAYSGGIDSTNMLETFYYNNIHIDEILMIGAFSQQSEFGTDDMNKDITINVLPTLKKLNLKNTKINIIDYSTYFAEPKKLQIVSDYGTDWVYHIGGFMNMQNIVMKSIQNNIKNDSRKTAIIFGNDKPYIFLKNKKYYTQFKDLSFIDYGGYELNGDFKRINFYTNFDSTDIIKKQLHTILNFQKQLNRFDPKYLIIYNTKIIEALIYPNIKNPLIHHSSKAKTNIFARRDSFMLDKTNTEIFKIYKDGILKLKKNSPNNIFQLNAFKTRDYEIGIEDD